MRHFYKFVEGVPLVPFVNAVMHQQDLFRDSSIILRDGYNDSGGMGRLLGAKKLALTIMQLVDGCCLGSVELLRLDAGANCTLRQPDAGFSRYLVVLQGNGGAGILCADESVKVHSGEVWWLDGAEDSVLMNKAGDDLLVMALQVRVN